MLFAGFEIVDIMILKYKATLPKNKFFFREYEIRSEMKLYKVHEFIQNDLGFAPDQMVLFEGVNEDKKKKSEYGLFDMGDGSMDSITLEKTLSKGEKVLNYVYGVQTNRYLILTYMGESEFDPRGSYPRLVAEKGQNPDQFSDVYEDYSSDVEGLMTPPVTDDSEGDLYEEDELPEGEE